MKKRITFILILIALIASAGFADDAEDAVAGCLGCSFMIFWIFGAVVWLGLSIWATVWVKNDAERRGLENANTYSILMILGIFFGFWWIVWIVYMVTHSRGETKYISREGPEDEIFDTLED